MDVRELYHLSVHAAGQAMTHLQPEHMHAPTPCTEWDVRALLNHMVYELVWVPDMLAGKTIAEVGGRYDGDLLGDDPRAAWVRACKAASAAAADCKLERTVHLSYGDMPASHYLYENGADMLIHGWDMATALGAEYHFDEELAEALYKVMKPREAEMRASGLFGDEVTVDKQAPISVRLLALYGRKA